MTEENDGLVEIQVTLRVRDLGDDRPAARDALKLGLNVYTQMTEGNTNSLARGVNSVNVMRYLVVDSGTVLPDYMDMPNDDPYPFTELEESEATLAAEFARRALQIPMVAEYLARQMELEEKYLSDLLTKLTEVLDAQPD